tara:strand:+ start:2483 stop:2881 length:399 start_codon:yes stop_codon:yes gene_type:complete
MVKNKFQIRFNLGAGDNYKKWKVTSPQGDVQYIEPNEVNIFMEGCKLCNQKGTATKIFEGANKTVCAWVEADNVVVMNHVIDNQDDFIVVGDEVSYNPRVTPNWTYNNENVDKSEFSDLVTKGRAIYSFPSK